MKLKHATVRTNDGEKYFKFEIWDSRILVFRLRGSSYEKLGSAETMDDALVLVRGNVSGTIRGIDLRDG